MDSLHPKRTGSSVEAAVIEREPALAPVDDREAEWHDAETVEVLAPRPNRPLGGVCLVEPETPVEIKGCIPEQSNGDGQTPGRWYIKRVSHDQLVDAGAFYYLTVYAPLPETPLIASMVVPAATVGDLLDGSWYDNGRREVAKLGWPRIFDREVVRRD
nr:hypothetical protein [Halovenus carboxidivorans]